MKRALITGITGQDGAYLAKLLLSKGYEVYGAHRRAATPNLGRLEALGIEDQVKLVPFELLEYENQLKVLREVNPSEIYNLAAQSFVGLSFELPIYTSDVDGIGVTRLLEAVRAVCPLSRFYQASTSEMFGNAPAPQSEVTELVPRSPYGVAKLYAHHMVKVYREAYGLYACSGILFNHESPLRGGEFVTQKICNGLKSRNYPVKLGNLDAKRDWGFAGDYVEAMWLMLQPQRSIAPLVQDDRPKDYVIATGQTSTVRNFCSLAAKQIDMDLIWDGSGVTERGICSQTGETIFAVSEEFYRPAEVDILCGDARRAFVDLGWKARTSLPQLVAMMMRS
jgi:GDPmannose 4,6-dehydratase